MSQTANEHKPTQNEEGGSRSGSPSCYPHFVDHQGVFGEVMDGVVVVHPGRDATTCSRCGNVIVDGRLATATECREHECRMSPEQEVDFILGVTGCEVTDQQRETMLKMAHFDNQRIEEEFGGMY